MDYPVAVGILTDIEETAVTLTNRARVPERVVHAMAAHARAILVDAWDQMGIVVWEPADARDEQAAASRQPAERAD